MRQNLLLSPLHTSMDNIVVEQIQRLTEDEVSISTGVVGNAEQPYEGGQTPRMYLRVVGAGVTLRAVWAVVSPLVPEVPLLARFSGECPTDESYRALCEMDHLVGLTLDYESSTNEVLTYLSQPSKNVSSRQQRPCPKMAHLSLERGVRTTEILEFLVQRYPRRRRLEDTHGVYLQRLQLPMSLFVKDRNLVGMIARVTGTSVIQTFSDDWEHLILDLRRDGARGRTLYLVITALVLCGFSVLLGLFVFAFELPISDGLKIDL